MQVLLEWKLWYNLFIARNCLGDQWGILVVPGGFLKTINESINVSVAAGFGCGPTFEQTHIPITSHLVEIVRMAPRRLVFNVYNAYHYFSLLTPPEKGCGPLFEETLISCTKDDLYPVWLKMSTQLWKCLLSWYFVALENVVALYLNKFESPSHKNVLCRYSHYEF